MTPEEKQKRIAALGHDYKPISVQHEGKFPNHETVLFSLNDPDWVIHRASNRCQTEHPHHITKCKEFESEENTLWKST